MSRADPALPSIGIVMHDFALGGTERIATRLATRWAEEGAIVRIFCGSREGDMRALLGDLVEVVEASPIIARGFGSRTALGRAAARHFRERPVDIVFLPGNFHWPVAPALAALPRDRRPAIAAQVSATLSKPQRGIVQQKLFEWRMRHLLRDVQAVVTLSDAATAQAETILGRSVVYTIPLPALGDHRIAPLPVPEESRIILAVGRLVPEKGFDMLIESFAALPDPAAELVIVGEGPDRARLEGLIAQYAVTDRVRLPGYVADTRGWLDKARLAAMPSRFEGYPAVLVEAFAAGRPAVATACTPATAELIDTPHAGRVVAVDDCGGMTAAIGAMLDSPVPDPMRLAARVERHRIGPVSRAYLALFQGLTVANRP